MTKPKARNETGIWSILAAGHRYIIWSEPCMLSENVAIAKWRRLTKKSLKKGTEVTSSHLVTCPVDNCYSFASEFLIGDELAGIPGVWMVSGSVQKTPTGVFGFSPVCPMCEKHARRFRKSLQRRILRIEERLDDIEREELEEG